MTQSFRFNKEDGYIFIMNNDIESIYPFAWWTTQQPEYNLPDLYVWDEYIKDVSHYYYTFSTQYKQTFPWAQGDLYISKKAEYDLAYATYLNTPQTLEEAKTQKINELTTKMIEIKNGGVIYNGNTFASNESFYQRLLTDDLNFTTIGVTPEGYYILDINNIKIPCNLTALQNIVLEIQDLYYKCWLNYDSHYADIQACINIGQVDIIDVTTGWPIVPYKS